MGLMNGKSRFPIDAALILRDFDQAAVTADTDLAVQKMVDGPAWYDPKNIRHGLTYLVGEIESIGGDVVPTGLAIEIYTASNAAKANEQLQLSVPVNVVGRVFEIPVDPIALLKADTDATHWFGRLQVTGGTNPTVGFNARLGQKPPV